MATPPVGITTLTFLTPTYTPVAALDAPIIPVSWKTQRFQNRVGSWEAEIRIDHPTAGDPLAARIKRGWHVSIVHADSHPNDDEYYDFMLYRGVVLDREFAFDEAGLATLKLKGSFRTLHLVERMTLSDVSLRRSIASIVSRLALDDDIIGVPGGIITPLSAAIRWASVTFTNLTRWAAILRAAELGRFAVRESWDFDRPELTRIDRPPAPGITFKKYDSAVTDQAEIDEAASNGFGIIAGVPKIRYEGAQVVNRIIPIGADTPEGELTLEFADDTDGPYTIQQDVDGSGNDYWYIEDAASIALYGLIEKRLIRTDVRNPSDDPDTREEAANVLYAVAVNELLKGRSERLFVDLPIANGSQIWVLPGDMIRVNYQGVAETEAGELEWLDLDNKRFLVTERIDQSDPSGARRVDFRLAAPEIEYEIPELPGEIALPPLTPVGGGGALPGGIGPGGPPIDPCCVDPTTQITFSIIPRGDGFLFVGSNDETGRVWMYSAQGVLVATLNITAPDGRIAGVDVSPETGQVYALEYVDQTFSIFAVPNLIFTGPTVLPGPGVERRICFVRDGTFYTNIGSQLVHYRANTSLFDASTNPVTSPVNQHDIATDQRTIFYIDQDGPGVYREHIDDIENGFTSPLFDFATLANNLYDVRILAPGDGSGGVLVVDQAPSIRRLDGSGNEVWSIPAPAEAGIGFYRVALSASAYDYFWAADLANNIWKYRLSTGELLLGPIPVVVYGGTGITSLCVFGGYRASID